MYDRNQKLIAEFLGTFTLVFVGVMAVYVASNVALDQGGGYLGVTVAALAHGLILIGLIYTFGHISGAHFNPAVTAGLLVSGKIEAVEAVLYWIAQFLGGIAAGLLASLVTPASFAGYGETIGVLTASDIGSAAIIEFVLTFFLVSAIFQTAVHGKGGSLTGVAIGLTLAGSIFAGGVFTGASLNPARTLGPAIAAALDGSASTVPFMNYVPVYLIAIFLGGIAAGLLHTYILKPRN